MLGYYDDDDNATIMLLVSTIRHEVQEKLYSCPGGRQMFSPKKSVNLLRWKKVVFLANRVMTMRYIIVCQRRSGIFSNVQVSKSIEN